MTVGVAPEARVVDQWLEQSVADGEWDARTVNVSQELVVVDLALLADEGDGSLTQAEQRAGHGVCQDASSWRTRASTQAWLQGVSPSPLTSGPSRCSRTTPDRSTMNVAGSARTP